MFSSLMATLLGQEQINKLIKEVVEEKFNSALMNETIKGFIEAEAKKVVEDLDLQSTMAKKWKLEEIAEAVADVIDLDDLADKVVANIAVSDIANELDLDDLADKVAKKIDLEVVANSVDTDDIANNIKLGKLAREFSPSDIASELDLKSIAEEIDLNDLAENLDVNAVATRFTADYAALAQALLARIKNIETADK